MHTYVQTFSVTGGPADVIGSWFSEEWYGSNAADGSFTYQAKDGELGLSLTWQPVTLICHSCMLASSWSRVRLTQNVWQAPYKQVCRHAADCALVYPQALAGVATTYRTSVQPLMGFQGGTECVSFSFHFPLQCCTILCRRPGTSAGCSNCRRDEKQATEMPQAAMLFAGVSEFPQPGQNPGNGSTAVYCESGRIMTPAMPNTLIRWA